MYDASFSPDGSRLASASVDGTIRIWDVEEAASERSPRRQDGSGERNINPTAVIRSHTGGAVCVAFDATGTRLASAGHDSAIRVWDVDPRASLSDPTGRRDLIQPAGRLIATLRGHAGPIRHVFFTPNGAIISGSDDGTVKKWLPDLEDVPVLEGHYTSLRAVAFTPEDRHLVTADGQSTLIFWDVAATTPVAKRYLYGPEGVNDIAIWTAGPRTLLAAATAAPSPTPSVELGGVHLWDITVPSAPVELAPLVPRQDHVNRSFESVAISRNGVRLAVGERDGHVCVWNVEDVVAPRVLSRFEVCQGTVRDVVFLDNEGEWLLTTSDTSPVVSVWNAESGTLAGRHTGHTGGVKALAVAPDGDVVASGSADQTIRLWHVKWRENVPELLPAGGPLVGHLEVVQSVVFHPTERRLFSASFDCTIRVWDVDTGTEVATLHGHAGGVSCLAVDGAGMRLASASRGFEGLDNVARLWEAPREESELPATLLRDRATMHRAHTEVRRLLRTAVATPEAARAELARRNDLPDDVRKAALDNFELFALPPESLDMRAWPVAVSPDRSENEYARALAWAEMASRLSGDDGEFLTAVGLLRYRLKRYDEALPALTRAGSMLSQRQPSALAGAALTLHTLGRTDEARAFLDRAEKLLEVTSPEWRWQSEVVAEAREVVRGSD